MPRTKRFALSIDASGLERRACCFSACRRYREILFDFSTEFKKTSAAIQSKREATELFKSSR